jgi:hypothetical protein
MTQYRGYGWASAPAAVYGSRGDVTLAETLRNDDVQETAEYVGFGVAENPGCHGESRTR